MNRLQLLTHSLDIAWGEIQELCQALPARTLGLTYPVEITIISASTYLVDDDGGRDDDGVDDDGSGDDDVDDGDWWERQKGW